MVPAWGTLWLMCGLSLFLYVLAVARVCVYFGNTFDFEADCVERKKGEDDVGM